MPDQSSGITFRTIQEAMPEYHISDDLVRGVLVAMPAPAPGISRAFRHERLARVVDEVAARVPMDAAQGHLAGQLVVVEFLAFEMLERVTTWDLPLAERRLASRTSDDLIRSITRLERTLERRQARVMPFRDVGAADGFDLDMLDRVWCRGVPAASAEPVAAAVAPEPAVAGVSAVPESAVPESAMPEQVVPAPAVPPVEGAAAVVGQAADAGNSGGLSARGRAGVTLEQGDGWSVERWPAGAGAAVVSGPETRGKLARPVAEDTAMAEAAPADRGAARRAATERPATGRPGSRGRA
jgi:hypothetical protein